MLIARRAEGERAHDEVVAAARAAVAATAAGARRRRARCILFPEGTRGPGGMPRPFKSGLYHLCRERPGLELVPVWLDHLNRVLPKGEFVPVPLVGDRDLRRRRSGSRRARSATPSSSGRAPRCVALWGDRPRPTTPEAR